ncbi:DUF1698 domain-containing protein [Microvirgula aerodenitrificans]|uniref:class I SAM-dependent methyltransferase n=1 Tax=Microvirgula aerodenitrificans TaxID=57480 RepID=UPI0028EB6BE0|nr:DUF1698 domain-containing protein [Microvirgula aerodenitrificans]
MNDEQWLARGLPADLCGLNFLEVGCWEGLYCVEARRRGAQEVVGIDYCVSPDLVANLQGGDFTFIQMDILSEKMLQLPEFDVVYSAGVLYHLEDPLSFLFRLRKLARVGGVLALETTCFFDGDKLPVMLYHPENSLDNNPSNWWTPNEACLIEMLSQAGFGNCQIVSKNSPITLDDSHDSRVGRICIKAVAEERQIGSLQKLLPRRPSYMPCSASAGSRQSVERK